MLRRILAVVILMIATVLFIVLFIPFVINWLITGKDYATLFTSRVLDVFVYLVKNEL